MRNFFFFFFNDTATTEIYTLSLHDALPITGCPRVLSTRATLTPLPPGIEVCSTVRWRRPSRKFGTASVLSIAVLSVTVMIMRSPPPGGRDGGRWGRAVAPAQAARYRQARRGRRGPG